MQPYITLGVKDADTANAFYDAILAAVGWSSHMSFPGWRAYSAGGTGEGFTIWVCQPFDGQPGSAGNGTMLGLPADSHEAVEAFHAAAMAHGGTDEGAPGHRAHYGPNWFAAYVRDPSGNKIGCVFNG